MFFTLQVLSRRGSLGTVWIAAHLDKKLKRQQISETDIRQSVDQIMNPEAPFALRLSSQLLFGLVRVYRRQVSYLFQDCNDALNKIHDAFVRTTLPEIDAQTALKSLTLPEEFFSLNPLDVNAYCAVLANGEAVTEDDSLMEAFAPGDLWKGDALWLTDGGWLPPAGETEHGDLPPVDDLILEEPVARAQSSMAQQSLPLSVEAVMRRTSSQGLEESKGQEISSLSADAHAILKEGDEADLRVLDLAVTETPQDLTRTETELPAEANRGLQLPTLIEDRFRQPDREVHQKAVAKVSKKPVRLHIDIKGTTLSNSEYKRMLRDAPRRTQKPRSFCNARSLESRKEEWIHNSCLNLVHSSPEMDAIWKTNVNLAVVETRWEGEEFFDPERARWEADEQTSQLSPLFPSERSILLSPSILSGSVGEREGSLTVRQSAGNVKPDRESEIWNEPIFASENAPAGEEMSTLPAMPDEVEYVYGAEEEPSNPAVLTHLKRRFTELSECLPPRQEETDCPSPKRRRLPSLSPSAAISVFEVMKDKTRADAGRWFYDLLVLRSRNLVKLKQDAPYADIQIQEVQMT